jgi:AcrR family transcriptional regulator
MVIKTPARLNRQQQAEVNQQRLLDAALEVFTERGFHGATLEQIAAAAGFTTGVVYSRFASKADLFLALLESTIEQRIVALRSLDRARLADTGAVLARSWWDQVRKRPEWMLVVIEFRVHAARVPELNARYAALHDRHVRALAEVMAHEPGRAGRPAAKLPVGDARIALALGSGLVLEHWATADETIGKLVEQAAATISRGMVSPGPAPARPRRKRA